jgi:hypothetical protein
MKSLKLFVENKGWELFTYTEISELLQDFKDRKISIGDGASHR